MNFDQNIARGNISAENTYPKKCSIKHFLGFTHICARSRQGKFTVHVKTMDKRLRRGLKSIADWCKRYRHSPVDEQQQTLNAKLRGHYQYYGRRTNYASIRRFYREVCGIWRKWLNRRTRGNQLTREKFYEVLRQNPLLTPEVKHT
jgi:RNA-directed DNA polymerase